MSGYSSNSYNSAFFIVPSYILDLRGLTLGYLRVYETIFQFWNHNKSCFLSEKSLCERTGLKRTQIYAALAYFVEHNELKRVQKGNRRYIVKPERIIETDCPTLYQVSSKSDSRTNISQPSGVADEDVRCSGRKTSGVADYNNKNRTKETKETTTTAEDSLSSSSFFSLKQTTEFLKLKLETDPRTDHEFVANCHWHVEKQENEFTKYRRVKGLLRILDELSEAGEHFKASGFNAKPKSDVKKETDEERQDRQFFEYELMKERDNAGYVSEMLKKFPDMRQKYA